MAVDSLARVLAMAAIDAAESGGGGSQKGIDNVYILDDHLHIVFTDGTDTDLGSVVGADGKVYIPHIDEHKILSWTLEEKAQEIPDPVDLNPFDEWEEIEEDGDTDYYWEDM